MVDSIPVIPVILSGGMGSRLWPMSRTRHPKQFLPIGDPDQSMLQQTAARVSGVDGIQTPLVVSNIEHRFLVAEHLRAAGFDDAAIILEPMMRNTAPAIAAAAHYIKETYENALMLVLPSDHIITDEPGFHAAINQAIAAAKAGYLTTFGIDPAYPETGYGYIKEGDELDGYDGVHAIARFVEKPDEDTAKSYLAEGGYAWNSGMFLYPVKEFLEEMDALQPDIHKHSAQAVAAADRDREFVRLDKDAFAQCPDISIDYAIMEPTKRAAVVSVSCGWSDAGAWDSLWRIGDKDENDNVIQGAVYARDLKGCYVQSNEAPPIAAVGLEDIVIVSTRDSVLVAHKDRAQDVKKLMEMVRADRPGLVDHHRHVHTPWGYYEIANLNANLQSRHMVINEKASLMIQSHADVSKHWLVLSGTGKSVVAGDEREISAESHVLVTAGNDHQLINTGDVPLEVVEVPWSPSDK